MKARKTYTCIVLLAVFIMMVMTACQKTYEFKGKLLDMTYPYDENTIYWPNAEPFQLTKGNWGITETGYWYASNE